MNRDAVYSYAATSLGISVEELERLMNSRDSEDRRMRARVKEVLFFYHYRRNSSE